MFGVEQAAFILIVGLIMKFHSTETLAPYGYSAVMCNGIDCML